MLRQIDRVVVLQLVTVVAQLVIGRKRLRYHSYQLQDNYTIYLPQHSLTFGVSVEKYHSANVFFPGAQSVYVYNSLADFYGDANCYLANVATAGSCTSSGRSEERRVGQEG